MARTVKDAKLDSRAARSKLAARHEPYWRTIDQGMHLGYRKGARAASWLARRRKSGGGYAKKGLGTADDIQDANNIDILTFGQAQARARDWFGEQARRETGGDVGPLTVSGVMNRYLEWFQQNRKGLQSVRYNVNIHIVPELGDMEVSALTARQIRKWHQALAAAPARLRTRRGGEQKHRAAPATDEEKRSRKVTANKVLATLKAALNQAFADGDIGDDEAWRKVKPFRDVEAPRVRYLTTAECVRLINACDEDFRRLVRAALLTGARYGELILIETRDFSRDAGAIHLRQTKSGKPRDVPLNDEGIAFFEEAVAGLARDALVFRRPDGEPWGKSHQRRRLEAACKAASIEPSISFHILRHCYGSSLAMQGVPLPVIAAVLGHADTRITERHYSHLAPSYVADTIRANLPNMMPDQTRDVVPLKQGVRDA